MRDPEVLNLCDEEFEELSKQQSKLFPDLLLFRSEEDIIDEFYQYYKKKRTK